MFRDFIELFIPLMPKEQRENRETFIRPEDIVGEGEALSRKAEATQRCYDEERDRTRVIEGKASMFITSSGFLGTVLIGTSNIIISQTEGAIWLRVLMLFCLLFFTGYMVGTILFALNALRRSTFSRPDPSTILDLEDKEFVKQTIADMTNSTTYNLNASNHKMDYVVLAQKYYKRLMYSVLAFVVVLLIYVFHESGISLMSYLSKINSEVSTWTLQFWFILIILVLVGISLVVGTIALIKSVHAAKKIKNKLL